MSDATPEALRRRHTQARRAQGASAIVLRSQAITAHCMAAPALQQATQVASYIATPSEVQTAELNRAMELAGIAVFAPVVRGKQMHFSPLQPPLRRASTGNWQPPLQQIANLGQLDVVLLPLVAFDRTGNRLGMGGGYYDRRLASRKNRGIRRPLRVGLAFDCQMAAQLPAQAWDVPLHAVVTESGWVNFS